MRRDWDYEALRGTDGVASSIWDFLAHALRQHQNTLEHITFTTFDHIENEEDEHGLQEVYHIEYRRLKQLEVCILGWWILRNAPMLEKLKISASTIRKHMAVLDTIPPMLKKLELNVNDHLDLRCKAHLARYIERFAQHSQLKELAIGFYSLQNIANILRAIHRLNQLQRLTIIFSTKWHYDQMESFMDGLVKGCQKLACLEINCHNAPSTHAMNSLKKLEHLERLAFSIQDVHNDVGFWRAIQSIPQLKCIRVYPASAAKMDDIRHLQEQRLDLKIILDRRFRRFDDPLQTTH